MRTPSRPASRTTPPRQHTAKAKAKAEATETVKASKPRVTANSAPARKTSKSGKAKPAPRKTQTARAATGNSTTRTAAPAKKSATPAASKSIPVRTAARTGLSKSSILEMQRLLGRLSFLPGSPDGVMGAKTVEAIRRYQAFAGLQVDGKATPVLLEELRIVAGDVTTPAR